MGLKLGIDDATKVNAMGSMRAIQKVPLNQIDLSDETFSVNFMPELQCLRTSLQTVGLIQPVLLKKVKDHFQIVSGFRRIRILRDLGWNALPAIVFEERDSNDLTFFLLGLQENLTTRGFNAVEKAIALQKLISRFQVEPSEVVKTYLPLFSLEPNEKILNTYLSLAEMEDEVKAYVLKEEVSRSNIRLLAKMSSEDRLALLPLLSRLRLGENRLREMLTLLMEISRRDRVRMKEILDRPDLQPLLSQENLTSTQRTERVKSVLLNLRYPKLRELEEEFEKRVKRLRLPEGVSLRPSPYFEARGLRMEVQFKSMEEYRSILSYLSQLADEKEFEEMMKPISYIIGHG